LNVDPQATRPPMKISCLTVTQISRIAMLRRCLSSYAYQTIDVSSRELLLLHHDGPHATSAFQRLATDLNIEARVIEVPRAPLGRLRNLSIEHARGELLCQWDDDDFYHPDRLLTQSSPFDAIGCVATSLDSQFFWFRDANDLYIRRGGKEGIHGTVMFRNGIGLKYDEVMTKGEDSRFMQDLLKHGNASVVRIDNRPELYVRTYHGLNTWDLGHHRSHTRQALSADWLIHNETKVRDWIRTLGFPRVKVRDPQRIAFTVEPEGDNESAKSVEPLAKFDVPPGPIL